MASSSSSTLEKHHKYPMPTMSLDQNIEANSSEEAVDRISDLPDPLLCHILSFLTTKEAVATSTLSTRWKTLFTDVPVIDLQEEVSPSMWDHLHLREDPLSLRKPRTRFSYIVNRVFAQRTLNSLKKLHLVSHYNSCDPIDIMKWLWLVLVYDIEEIDLSFFLEKHVHLPNTLFTCESLVVLKLCGSINITYVPFDVNLPKLKTLDIMGVKFADVSFVTNMLSGCPILEYFSVDLMTVGPTCTLKVSKPSLKKLFVSCRCCKYHLTMLEIDTPSLEFIDIKATSILYYSIKNVHSLVEARIDVSVEKGPVDPVFDIFKAFRGIKFMTLPLLTTKAFTIASNSLDLPEFGNLVRLEITISCDSHLVVKLLQKCPKLDVLVVEKDAFDCDDETPWIEPTTVPDCLSSHLTVFTFKGYKGSRNELRLAAYVLRNANLLKKMIVRIFYLLQYMKVTAKVQKQLFALPRASTTCEFVFEQ